MVDFWVCVWRVGFTSFSKSTPTRTASYSLPLASEHLPRIAKPPSSAFISSSTPCHISTTSTPFLFPVFYLSLVSSLPRNLTTFQFLLIFLNIHQINFDYTFSFFKSTNTLFTHNFFSTQSKIQISLL